MSSTPLSEVEPSNGNTKISVATLTALNPAGLRRATYVTVEDLGSNFFGKDRGSPNPAGASKNDPASVSSASSAASGKSCGSERSGMRRNRKGKQSNRRGRQGGESPQRVSDGDDNSSRNSNVRLQQSIRTLLGNGSGRGPPAVGYNLCVRVGKICVIVDKLRVDRTRVRLAEVEVGDETGTVSLRARGEQIDLLQEISDDGSSVVLRNAVVELFLGRQIRLAVTRWGKMTRYPDGIMSTPPEPKTINRGIENLSELDVSTSFCIASDTTKQPSVAQSPNKTLPQQHQQHQIESHQPAKRSEASLHENGSPCVPRKSRQAGRQSGTRKNQQTSKSSSNKFHSDGEADQAQHASAWGLLPNHQQGYNYRYGGPVGGRGPLNQRMYPNQQNHRPGRQHQNRSSTNQRIPKISSNQQGKGHKHHKNQKHQQCMPLPSMIRRGIKENGGLDLQGLYGVGVQQPGSMVPPIQNTYSSMTSPSMIHASPPSHYQGSPIHTNSSGKDHVQQPQQQPLPYTMARAQLSPYQPTMISPHHPHLLVLDGNYVLTDASGVSSSVTSPTHHVFPSAGIGESSAYVLMRQNQYGTQQASHGWDQGPQITGSPQMNPRAVAYDPSQQYSNQVPYYSHDPMYPVYTGGMMIMPTVQQMGNTSATSDDPSFGNDMINSVDSLTIEGQHNAPQEIMYRDVHAPRDGSKCQDPEYADVPAGTSGTFDSTSR
mmetsp:Transcript_26602/g.52986  ORF Transcript_26602/g.52986 Transcript_26602/m.52986 type:complete len:713 (+) Transcript_26602:24-2162(+)